MKKHSKSLVSLLCLALFSAPALAQPDRALENRVSVCVDPATPPLVARSADEREGKKCNEWSQIGSTSTVLDVLQFVNVSCTDPKAPLGEFLRAILRTWNGQFPARNPSTSAIYGSPGTFQLRLVGSGESRVDALIVWKGSVDGMAALVVADENEPGAKQPDLKNLKLLYPARGSNCGKLEEISADALANDLVAKKIIENPNGYKLLVARRARLFWNQWIERSDSGSEEPTEISTDDYFRYKISFSALDFEAHRHGDRQARDRLPPGEVEEYLPKFDRFRIYVLPIGKFEKRGTVSQNIEIRRETLKRTLIDSQLAKGDSYKQLAEQYDALAVIGDDGQRTQTFSKEFRVTNAGCAALAVIVWNETRQKIETSWNRLVRVVSDEPVESEGCNKLASVSRRTGPTLMPWFDTADDPNAKARIGFFDFGDNAIGSYQDLRQTDEEPLSWALEGRLRDNLSKFTDFVNARVNGSNFDMREASTELWKVLFKCKDLDDRDCDGIEALRRLRHLAEESPGTRVQASFRDIEKNGTYYLPVHLLDAAGTLLRIRFVQPFPVPTSESARRAECVRDWSGSLIVEDVRFFDENGWRTGFFKAFVGLAGHRLFKEPDTLDKLRDDYLAIVA